jgi:hypothetical protein
MIQGQRHRERRETLAYWPVRDAEKGEAVGLVTDISDEGMQIHSEHGFAKGETLKVRITLDTKLVGTDRISAVIENVWCQPSGLSGLYHAGFKVVNMSDKAKLSLRKLMEVFSYPAPGRTDYSEK